MTASNLPLQSTQSSAAALDLHPVSLKHPSLPPLPTSTRTDSARDKSEYIDEDDDATTTASSTTATNTDKYDSEPSATTSYTPTVTNAAADDDSDTFSEFRADSPVNTRQVSLTKSDSDIATESLSDVDATEPESSASSEPAMILDMTVTPAAVPDEPVTVDVTKPDIDMVPFTTTAAAAVSRCAVTGTSDTLVATDSAIPITSAAVGVEDKLADVTANSDLSLLEMAKSCDAEEWDRLFHNILTHSLENMKLEEEDKSAVAEQDLDVSDHAPPSLVNAPAAPAVTVVDKEVATLELLFGKTPPESKSPDLQFVSILAV